MQLKKQYEKPSGRFILLLIKQHIVKQIVFTPIGIYGKVAAYLPVNTLGDWLFFGVRKYSDTKKINNFFQIKCSDSKKIIILICPNI